MAWIVDQPSSQAELANRFKELMTAPDIMQIPGAHDAMAALVAKQAGFSALYLSGAAYTASTGLPDLGIVTSAEVAQRAKEIISASNIPLVLDIDTGVGGVLNGARTAREIWEAQVRRPQLEGQALPK